MLTWEPEYPLKLGLQRIFRISAICKHERDPSQPSETPYATGLKLALFSSSDQKLTFRMTTSCAKATDGRRGKSPVSGAPGPEHWPPAQAPPFWWRNLSRCVGSWVLRVDTETLTGLKLSSGPFCLTKCQEDLFFIFKDVIISLLFSHSVVSDSFRPQ